LWLCAKSLLGNPSLSLFIHPNMAEASTKPRIKWGERSESKWGDDEKEEAEAPAPLIPSGVARFESKPDKDGIKTIVEYLRDEDGRRVKITRRVKVTKKAVRENKNVMKRRQWKKFGACTGLPPGPEDNVTYTTAEKIVLDLTGKAKEQEELFENIKLKNKDSIVVCRLCGGTGHWTLKCPKRNEIKLTSKSGAELPHPLPDRVASSEAKAASATSTTGKYVPPRARFGAGASTTEGGRSDKYGSDEPTLRVTNLSEDTTEQDLRDLFQPFGPTARIYLAKDKETHISRGFAFVNFLSRDDGARAIEKLDGYGYDNLILHVEWAKPRDK